MKDGLLEGKRPHIGKTYGVGRPFGKNNPGKKRPLLARIIYVCTMSAGYHILLIKPSLVALINSIIWRTSGPSGTCSLIWRTASNTLVWPWNTSR